MTVKIMDGIQHDISSNPPRTWLGWKVSKTRHFTLKMCVYDLHFIHYEALLVKQQQ